MNHLTETSISVLTQMVTEHTGNQPTACVPLAQSGSHRRYYRFTFDDNSTLIGAYNDDVAENLAFSNIPAFSQHSI